MEQLIREMNEAIEVYGLSSQEALTASQRLDIAVAEAQAVKYREYKAQQLL